MIIQDIQLSINATGNRLAIVATRDRGNGINAGCVRIHERNTMGWVRLGADIDGEAIDDYSGFSVSIDSMGNRVAIGASFNDGNGFQSGHARVYQHTFPTGINEVEREPLLLTYPYPVGKNLILETQNKIEEVAQITSIIGAVVFEFQVTKKKEKIDLSCFQTGIYFLRVEAVTKSNGSSIKRL
jgi:hypothetical protein